ncbi:unnamed protein product [Echinostoma caproni]|uniref:Reverse transcriptase domain-containing protein n=1 Tax=Echinostoma caproni TaxID=27848 RepID=A0A183ASJ0_9TREM|nr:unnamed protein product [Echinostoma caproni]
MADLSSLIKQREYAQLNVIMLQESWLQNEIEDEIIHPDGFARYRVDRPVSYSRQGGGVITYVKRQWCHLTKNVFTYSTCYMNASAIKKRAFKMHKRDAVRSLFKSIRAELQRLNSLYARALLDNKGSRETWQALMRISGIKSSHRSPAAVDIDSLNRSFINGGTAFTALTNGYGVNTIDPVSNVALVDIYKELSQLNPHKSCDPDGVPPTVLKECATFLSPLLCALFNGCISQQRIPDCRKLASINPVPKKDPQTSVPLPALQLS